MKTCLIVGAGISGLLAARLLQANDVDVTVLDKARGVGGRMATRRIHDAVFDHGAQYFTARDPIFKQLINRMTLVGAAKEWAHGFSMADGTFKNTGEPRFRGAEGMTSIPKYIAQSLDVRLQTKVTRIDLLNEQWQLTAEHGESFSSDALIVTSPVPQSLNMMAAGNFTLPTDAQSALEAIDYDPCIAVMVLLNAAGNIPQPGGVWHSGEPIYWIGDNQQKGISPQHQAVTIHAGPEFSDQHIDDLDQAGQRLLEAAADWLGGLDNVQDYQVHGWRYSHPQVLYPNECLKIDEPLPLIFAGDAFAGPRVEGAALSGIAAAEYLLEKFT